jgi:hypothetical protein
MKRQNKKIALKWKTIDMSKKKTSELNFREFLAEERALGNSFVDGIESDIVSRMLAEGFVEEEIYKMPMHRLYGLIFQVLGEVIETEFSIMSSENNASLANHASFENLTKQLKQTLDKLEKMDK